jgi:hypothetical protein
MISFYYTIFHRKKAFPDKKLMALFEKRELAVFGRKTGSECRNKNRDLYRDVGKEERYANRGRL